MIKSKTLSLLFALFLCMGMSAQGYTVIVNGTLANNQGISVPVTIQTIQGTVPSSTLTTQTNSGGFFTDSLILTSNPGWIMVSFNDCTGNLVSQTLQVQPVSPLFPTVVFANGTYCANQTVDCLGVVNGPAVTGAACTDTLGNTGIWDANCFCMTNTPPVDCLGIPGGSAVPGTSCFDALGNGGFWDINCNCIGSTGSNYVSVLVQMMNTQGQAIPVTIASCDSLTLPSFSYTTSTDPSGLIIDTTLFTTSTACISISFTDCNGNTVTQPITQSTAGNPSFAFTADWCPGAAIDCLGNPGGSALPGTACTDTLGNTGIWDANCFCMTSTPPVDCLGIPGGIAFPGTACVDTMGVAGIWDPNCICATNPAGTDCMGIPGGSAVPGTACVDSTGNTGLWDANCNCVANGTGSNYALVWLQMMNTQGQAIPVTIASCDSLTQPSFSYTASTDAAGMILDTILFTSPTACVSISFTDCNGNTVTQPITQATAGNPDFIFTADWCPGTTIDCLGNPGGSALPGTACVDSSGVSGTWDANCNCQPGQGTIDCLGIAGGTALPGTSCTDSLGNAGLWNLNCACITNTLADCLGIVGGTALPGTSCNDGNPNTFNDTWDLGCNCIGFLPMADCMGVIGGPDVPGAPCNDNDSTTVFDHWDWNCNCAGIPLNPGACSAQFSVFQSIDSTGTVVPNTLNVITLFALPTFSPGLIFSWDFGDGNTSNAAFPTHTYNGSGPYNLCVTISDSTCTDTYCDSVSVDTSGVIIRGQSGFTINVSPAQATSVQEVVETQIDFTLYPNPAMDEVTLSFADALKGLTNVSVVDVSGKLVLTNSFNASTGTQQILDIRKLDAGVYFLRVESENKNTAKRLVKATR